MPGSQSRGRYSDAVMSYRIGEAAELLGVSADTVRRWVDGGRLPAARDDYGHRLIAGTDLAEFARSRSAAEEGGHGRSSARNRLRGIVTGVVRDQVRAEDRDVGPLDDRTDGPDGGVRLRGHVDLRVTAC